MKDKLPSKTVVCDLCHQEFELTRDSLRDEKTLLNKDGETHEVTLTYLSCPKCGKQYPVVMDDEETLPILEKLQRVTIHSATYLRVYGKIPYKLRKKKLNLNWKLDFKRQQLAKKFNGALYQYEGDTIQLDYCYHAQ